MAGPLAMPKSEREAYLADLHVGVISIERAGRAPLAVPIWYDYDPAIGVWVITDRNSEKGRALTAAGRFALCAQSEAPPNYRYVSVEGPIASVRPADLESGVEGEANLLVFMMRPERWRTVDYAKLAGSGA